MAEMTEIVNNLESNLQKQASCYKILIQLEKEKQQVLVDNKIQEIEAITVQEEKILLEVSRLEEERLYWAEFFGKEIGKKAEKITLADLVKDFPSLDSVRKELEQGIKELKGLHKINTELLENAVNLVNFTMQSLTRDRQTTYKNPGEKTESKEKGSRKINYFDKSI